jgi:DNA-binding CsgD family transcriptional regulator
MTKIGVRNRVELAMWAYETQRMPPVTDQLR